MARPRISPQQRAVRRGLDTEKKVLYRTQPGPQDSFMASQAEELLYGGALGGGKSYGLRAYAVTYCMTYPGAKVALFRRSYRELEDTHILSIQQEVPSSIAMYSSGSHNLIFHNGSILMLRFCDTEDDARTYDTTEWDALLFDELTHFTQFQYVYLMSRVRSTKSWWPGPRIRCAATPLGVGHTWVKNRWIDNARPNIIWKAPDSEGGLTRQFIPAKATDNQALMSASPGYIDMLRALPEDERLAKVEGRWDVFSGQFFTRWRDHIHTCEPFDVPPDWQRFLCVDYGFNAPYAAYWFARPPNTQSAWVYREHYGSGISSEEQVYRAWQSTSDSSEKLQAVILDPSMFSKVNVKGTRVDSIADDWKDRFSSSTQVVKGNNDRIPGWRLMRELLDWTATPSGELLIPPRLVFFRTCHNAIRTIPLLIVSKGNVEDINTDMEDHSADALRYGLRHAFEGGGDPSRVSHERYIIGPKGIVVKRN